MAKQKSVEVSCFPLTTTRSLYLCEVHVYILGKVSDYLQYFHLR